MSTPGFYPKGHRHKPTLIFFDDWNVNTIYRWDKKDIDQILDHHGLVKKKFWEYMKDISSDVHTVHVDIREFPKMTLKYLNIGDILFDESPESKDPNDGVEL